MATAIAHRGPDAQKMLTESYAVVGFRRLAIVDLVTGDQPVRSRTRRIQALCNGEI